MKDKPERMCMVCRKHFPKNELIRIVLNKNGECFLDKTGKASGRGSYVCNSLECRENLIKKRTLNRVYKQNFGQEIYDNIKGALIIFDKSNK